MAADHPRVGVRCCSDDFVDFGSSADYRYGDDEDLCVLLDVLLLLYTCRAGTVIEVIN